MFREANVNKNLILVHLTLSRIFDFLYYLRSVDEKDHTYQMFSLRKMIKFSCFKFCFHITRDQILNPN
jgi:hypothetical protein